MNLSGDPFVSLAWQQIWQIAVVTILMAIVTRLACRRRPHLASILWMLVIVKALTPPVWSSPGSAFSWALAERPASSVQQHAAPPTSDADDDLETLSSAEPALPSEPTAANAVENTVMPAVADGWRPSIAATLFIVWATGSITLGSITAARWLRMLSLLRRSRIAASDEVQSLFAELAARLRVRKARLVVTSTPLGPAAFGWWPGTVLLPESLVSSQAREALSSIVAHELVHLRRRDTLAGTVQLVAQILWWFHPAVWWANRQVRLERERACDEEVVAALNCAPADYARALVNILQWRHQLRPALTWPGMRAWEVTAQRLDHLLRPSARFSACTPWWSWPLAAAIAFVVLPGAGLRLIAAPGEQSAAQAPDKPIVTGTFQAKGLLPAEVETDLAGPKFTAEQQAVVDDLKERGFEVLWDTFRKPARLIGRFTKAYDADVEPLPLEKLPGLKMVTTNEWQVTSEKQLVRQLKALRKLRPETQLIIVPKENRVGAAFDELQHIRQLQNLLVGELEPLADPGAMGRKLRVGQLTGLRRLQWTVRNGQALAELNGLKDLDSLWIQGDFSDEQLKSLSALTKLETLSVMQWGPEAISRLDMPWITPLGRLTTLRASFGVLATDTALANIARLPALRSLTIDSGELTDQGLQAVVALKNLRSFELNATRQGTRLTAAGLKILGKLTELRKIQLDAGWGTSRQVQVNSQTLLDWQGLHELRIVRLGDCDLSDAAVHSIDAWPNLVALTLHGDVRLTQLPPLEPPANVDFKPPVDLAGGPAPWGKKLTSLDLDAPHFAAAGMKSIGRLPQLQTLRLAHARALTADAVATLSQAKTLRSLSIDEANLTGAGLGALAALPSLIKLALDQCQLDAQSLAGISDIQSLRQVDLINTGLNDKLLPLLAGLKNVRELDLSHSAITDAGLVSLEGLTNLRLLKISSSQTTPEGRAALSKAISGLHVLADNLGFGRFLAAEDDAALLE